MLTLYHAPQSRSGAIVWLLEELEVPYELKVVSIRRGNTNQSEQNLEYRKIHPHAKVPAIVHDGVPVFETSAIALYLTDAFPEARLGPRVGEPLRGPYLSWLAYSTGVIEPANLEQVLNIPHHFAVGWGTPSEVVKVLQQTLQAGPYLLGEKFTAVDIVIGGAFPVRMQSGFLPASSIFTEYVKRITSRPACVRARSKDAGEGEVIMTGQCFCGSVAFEFDGPISDIEICHCSRCQRATGSPFVAEFLVRADKFRWRKGEESISFFDAPILHEPPAYRRSFCKKCGAAVPSIFAGNPFVAIGTGMVDCDIPAHAGNHIWMSRKANWLNLRELTSLPKFDRNPSPESNAKRMEPLEVK